MRWRKRSWLERAVRSLCNSTDLLVEIDGGWLIQGYNLNAKRVSDRTIWTSRISSSLQSLSPGTVVVSNLKHVVALVRGDDSPPAPWPLGLYVSEWVGGKRLPGLVQPLIQRVQTIIKGIRFLDPTSRLFALRLVTVGLDDAGRPIPILAAAAGRENRPAELQPTEIINLGNALLVAAEEEKVPVGLPEFRCGWRRGYWVQDPRYAAQVVAIPVADTLWEACRVLPGETIHLPDGRTQQVPATRYDQTWVVLFRM